MAFYKYVHHVVGNTSYMGCDDWIDHKKCTMCNKSLTFIHPDYPNSILSIDETRACIRCDNVYCSECLLIHNVSIDTGGLKYRNTINACVLCKDSWNLSYGKHFLYKEALKMLNITSDNLVYRVRDGLLIKQAKILQDLLKESVHKTIPIDVLKMVIKIRDNPC